MRPQPQAEHPASKRQSVAPPTPAPRRAPRYIGALTGTSLLTGLVYLVFWWALENSDPASGLIPSWAVAAMVVMILLLATLLARERSLRRALENELRAGAWPLSGPRSGASRRRVRAAGGLHQEFAALNALERRMAEVNAQATSPETHLEASQLCEEFVRRVSDSLAVQTASAHTRGALRARQERARSLQKHHLLAWARESSQELMQKAQRRVRSSGKIQMAQAALDVIERAQRAYPQEKQLHDSVAAIRIYVTSVRVKHWVELAERASFKGNYQRAVDRYHNALFYLTRDGTPDHARRETEAHIKRQIQSLQALLSLSDIFEEKPPAGTA